ncbi:MAG: T9SS type A sorting domain-containing protein [Bacteroidota bacterium]
MDRLVRYAAALGVFLTCALSTSLHAQSVLLVGVNTDATAGDQISFVATTAIPQSTVIYFTDREYSDTNNTFNTGEGLIAYTTPSGGLPIGEVVRIREEGGSATNNLQLDCSSGSDAACGSVSLTGSFSIGASDEYYAFTASNASDPATSITEILSYVTWQSSPPADNDPVNDYPDAGSLAFASPSGDQIKVDFLFDNGPSKRLAVRTDNTRAEYDNTSNWTRTLDDTSALSTQVFVNPMLTNSTPLPVELVQFDARADGSTVRLTWATASEVDNAGFEVQQRIGDQFERQTFVPGVGSSDETQRYTAILDRVASGTQVFRLKQIDLDGAFTYSPEIEVSVDLPGAYSLGLPYPNPFWSVSTFSVAVARSQHVDVSLLDLLGRRVDTLHRGPMEAERSYVYRLEAGDLSDGLYFIHVTGESFATTRQITLLK